MTQDGAQEVGALSNPRVVDRCDHVASLQPGLVSGPTRYDSVDQGATLEVASEMGGELGRDLLKRDAEPRALDGSTLDELARDALCDLRRDGKADAGAAADDHRVDAEHATL